MGLETGGVSCGQVAFLVGVVERDAPVWEFVAEEDVAVVRPGVDGDHPFLDGDLAAEPEAASLAAELGVGSTESLG